MSGKIAFTGLWVLLLISFRVLAQEKHIVAVFDIEDQGAGLKEMAINNLTEILSVKMAE